MESIHQGVGALITNTNCTRFLVQIKDETYPFEEWRGACAYWGGAIEPSDANELEAVERELVEEIPAAAAALQTTPKTPIDRYWIDTAKNPFWLTTFVIAVEDTVLDTLSQAPVLEGNSLLISKDDLLKRKWIWNIDFTFHDFLQRQVSQ